MSRKKAFKPRKATSQNNVALPQKKVIWTGELIAAIVSTVIAVISLYYTYKADKRADLEKMRADNEASRAAALLRKKEGWVLFLTKQLNEKDREIRQVYSRLQDDSVRLSFNRPSERAKAAYDIHNARVELNALQDKKILLEAEISQLRAGD